MSKYVAITDELSHVRRSLAEFHHAEATPERIRAVSQRLLGRANVILEEVAKNTTEMTLKGEDITSVVENLENVRESVALFGSTYGALKAGGERVPFGHIEHTEVAVIRATDLNDAQRAELRAIMRDNNQREYPSAMRPEVEEIYEKKFSDPYTKFYLLEHEGEIVAYMRFTPNGENRVYWGGFNTRFEAQEYGIGAAFLDECLKIYGANTVEAHVHDGNESAIGMYNKKFGFKTVGEDRLPGSGERLFKIERGPLFTTPQDSVRGG